MSSSSSHTLAFTTVLEQKKKARKRERERGKCTHEKKYMYMYVCVLIPPYTQTVASINELGSELRPGIQQIDSVLLELSNGVREFR